ncbi:uncharacterized protein LOC113558840 [Rhopalosiphum maidis]|uniref:uncharacterized protein LOC113558840 n=1 Tax=Rhopalosiphum maidis TaxID=43146 RepID=UPI000EFEDF71|nr:uncharacterized protein LOC113558840 [Rhopalosiphum maidis]
MAYFTRSHRSESTTPELCPSSSDSEHRHQPLNVDSIQEKHTAMSADSETIVKVNRPNDTQLPTDDSAASRSPPPTAMLEGDDSMNILNQTIKIENLDEETVDMEFLDDSFDDETRILNAEASNVGFYNGFELEAILGITQRNEKQLFLVKWKNRITSDLVEAKLIHEKYPQMAIRYYESIYCFDKNED